MQHLYQWQEDCLRTWEDCGYRGIVEAITGSGKTVLALSAIQKLLEKHHSLRTMIIVPTIVILRQWVQVCRDFFGERISIGEYSSDYKSDRRSVIMIYVVNSAREVLAGHVSEELRAGVPLFLIADECHHYASRENRRIFAGVRFPYTLGLSATADSPGMEKYVFPALGKVIYRYSFRDALKDQVISPFFIQEISLCMSCRETERYEDYSFKMGILYRKMFGSSPHGQTMTSSSFFSMIRRMAREDENDPAAAWLRLSRARKDLVSQSTVRMDCLCSLMKELLAQPGKILIFSERIAQAKAVVSALEKEGYRDLLIYHSEQDKQWRKRTLQDFKERQQAVLISCRALDEGMDMPDADTCIILSGTGMQRQRIQRLGRILRRSSGKRCAMLYYLYVKGTTEERGYFPQKQHEFGEKVFHLTYYREEQAFSHPAYECAAEKVLHILLARKDSPQYEKELRRCLSFGLLRRDWLESYAYCKEMEEKAESIMKKNYWFCMGLMQEESGDNDTGLST